MKFLLLLLLIIATAYTSCAPDVVIKYKPLMPKNTTPVTNDQYAKIKTVIDSIADIQYGEPGSHINRIVFDGRIFGVYIYGPGMDSILCETLSGECWVKQNKYLSEKYPEMESLGYISSPTPMCIPCGCNFSVMLDSNFQIIDQSVLTPFDSCSRYSNIRQ